MAAKKLFSIDFEVFGLVQGVFFRKYTAKQAKQLALRGWCMNTAAGTVKGQIEGPQEELNEMKQWLQNKGSPSSRIEKAVFTQMKPITDYSFQNFDIRQ